MKEINLNKQVFEKQAFDNTIDTSFSELTTSTQLVTTSSTPTIDQFFQDYPLPEFKFVYCSSLMIKQIENAFLNNEVSF